METGGPTDVVRGESLFIRRFAVTVVDGADRNARAISDTEELTIGTSEGNELRLTDPAVSRHHCSLRTAARGLELRDLGSRNGTFIGDTEIVRCFIQSGARIRVGHTTLVVEILDQEIERPLAAADRYGSIIGKSPAMRRLYPLIEQCAKSSATVLLFGETGTGKEVIAETIHEESDRKAGPFVVVDCSALSHELAEAELFGHEKGAFTGADVERIGVLEAAHHGTIFFDEIGELPMALQPLLLRVLENRTVRRVGSSQQRSIDVRVIAASHRDLRAEVNQRRFRPDLFYRLNVLRLVIPPLRERAGDVELLAKSFWQQFRSDRELPQTLLAQLASQPWSGNVRELRNHVERAALLGWNSDSLASPVDPPTYLQAKESAIRAWERGWVEDLVARHHGNLSRAARSVRMGRSRLREMVRRHGIDVGRDPEHDDE